ncbi:hypothetical protein [Methylocystis parvus]|uniref:Uncharacterized protein n=1 Tax=Methylocystis parvus TaxID=134 RepID=A0A6B8M308_9HYPH|nr:hypothetical protein [Methylocystis parvus]QGM96169.1 hypothetical protein F7D14_00790 [Methylocystis parvus]WBK00006.1 hypothetical protein MMG94_18825 [Methylocystis parvus OBBP]
MSENEGAQLRDDHAVYAALRRRSLTDAMGAVAPQVAIAVATAFLFIGASAPLAAGLTLKCGHADVMNPKWKVPLTFVYAGGDSGPINVSGPFGDFSINVKHTSRPAGIQTTGEALEGAAKAHVKLPPLADLETCIEKARDPASKPDDRDAFLNARDACLKKLEPPPEGIDAITGLRIGFLKDQDAFVDLRFRYEAASRAPDGTMVVEPLPAQCVLEK